MKDERKLVLHLLYRLDTGGLEQVLLDTVRELSSDFRHVVVSLTTASPKLRSELPHDVAVYELKKREGHAPDVWFKVYSLLRRLRPDVLHSYNISCLEFQAIAFLARVPLRLHAEHGRSAADPEGKNRKHRWLRRRMRLFVHSWITVSQDLYDWLCVDIGLPESSVALIYNGVDTTKFARIPHDSLPNSVRTFSGFCDKNAFVVGTVGRLDPVKNHEVLIEAWAKLLDVNPSASDNMVLVIVGGGPLEEHLRNVIVRNKLEGSVLLAGEHTNIALLMARFNLFVLPSIAEGLPMTLLEAMSSAKPVIASSVGGIPELVTSDTGSLLVPSDCGALVEEIISWSQDDELRSIAGFAARKRVVDRFGIDSMIQGYALQYSQRKNY